MSRTRALAFLRGFTLIELAVSLVILGLIALLAVELVPRITERMRLDNTTDNLQRLRDSIDGFAIDNHRLPCPDTDNDGIENCGSAVGMVAWRDVGLGEQARDEARRPLRYAVYQSTSDLSALTALFAPNLPDDLDITPGTVNGCDNTPDYTLISFESDNFTTFELASSAGFQVDEYVGLGIMDYTGISTVSNFDPCPCGGTDGVSCNQCTAFPDDTYVVGDTSDDVAQVASTTTSGDPGQFHSYFPGGTFAMPEPVEGFDGSGNSIGVTADGTNFTNLIAQIKEIDGTDLKVEVLESVSSSPFVVGETITGGTSGATGTVTGINATIINATVDSGTFENGETVTGGTSGGTATVSSSSPANYLADVTSGTPTVGQTLTGDNSGATATVQTVNAARVEVTPSAGAPSAALGDTITGDTSGATALVSEVGPPIVGFINSGTLINGENVSLSPSGETGTVATIVTQVSAVVDTGTPEITPTPETVSGGGVTAQIVSGSETASVTANDSSVVGGSGFAVGMEIHGSSSGAREEITGIVPPSGINFSVGDVVTDGSSTGTVIAAGDNWVLVEPNNNFNIGSILRIDGSGGPPPGGEILDVNTNATAIPTATPGSIARTPQDTSSVLNRLDFCQNLRDAHTASVLGGSGATGITHTVNDASVAINPAYLLASGGVENADGDAGDIAFDELNELAPDPLDFESPAIERRPGYDDVVATTPIEVLEGRFECGRNIGAVNAKAVSATTMKNNALAAFYLNEQAIRNVEVSYQAWQMAIVNRDIAIVQGVLDAVSTALELYKILMYTEGQAPAQAAKSAEFAIAAAVGITTTAVNISQIITDSQQAVTDSEETFVESCTAASESFTALGEADIQAATELQEAIEIDTLGGVK